MWKDGEESTIDIGTTIGSRIDNNNHFDDPILFMKINLTRTNNTITKLSITGTMESGQSIQDIGRDKIKVQVINR